MTSQPVRSRVFTLLAAELLLVVGGLTAIGHLEVAPAASIFVVLLFTAGLVALAFLPPLYLELRRHACWVTLNEVGLLIGWLVVGPVAVLGAAAVAEAAAVVRHRQPPLKMAFNFVHTTAGVVLSTAVFITLGQYDPSSAIAWGAGIVALAIRAVFDTVVTAEILSVSENRRFTVVLRQLGAPAIITFVTTASLGIAGVILLHHSAITIAVFVPILGMLVLATAGVSAQRAERVRVERLYAASSRLTRLTGLSDTLASIAGEAREMVTGAVAICCATDAAGVWIGMVVDDNGARPASRDTVNVIRGLASAGGSGEVSLTSLPRNSRNALPAANHVVWSEAGEAPEQGLVLAIFREIPQDDQGGRRTEVLRAFAGHAVTVVANVLLYEEVQDALRRQLDLNRQKDEFVATVSHELRTPLTSMIGSIQTMRRLGDRLDADSRTNLLDTGLAQGARLKRLIEDLLTVAASEQRATKFEAVPVDIPALLSELASDFSSSADGRLQLEVDAGVRVVLTDVEKLRRVLVNLIENAIKYAADGPIHVRAELVAEDLAISVSDQGPGIPIADRERIFERFVQLDQSSTRRQGGTGLGLHLSRELARFLGGRLTIADSPLGGARFILFVPAATPTAIDSGKGMRHGTGTPAISQRPAGISARPTSFSRPRPKAAAMVLTVGSENDA